MRKRFVIGTAVFLIVLGLAWFRFRQNRRTEHDDVKVFEVQETPHKTNETRLVSLGDISTEKLFERLAAPPTPRQAVVTNQYNGAPEVKPFIESTILEQANRMNSIFRFAVDASGRPKTL